MKKAIVSESTPDGNSRAMPISTPSTEAIAYQAAG
jgi:hypothetical protein